MRMGKMIWMLAAATALLSSGCASEDEVAQAERCCADLSEMYRDVVGKSDMLYISSIANDCRDPLVMRFLFQNVKDEYADSAWFKRLHALAMARGFLTYQFRTYIYYDGISGLLYNTAYLASAPNKVLSCLKCSDGVLGYVCDMFKLLFGILLSIVGLVAAPLVGLLCHPIETLANLTVGVFYFGPGWWTYVTHTNIFASLWDLIWGGMIYPLWQALTFWL